MGGSHAVGPVGSDEQHATGLGGAGARAFGSAYGGSVSRKAPGLRGLIDVARARGLGTLKPQAMTAQDWLIHVDPAGEIAGLRPRERARLIEQSAEWPFDHSLVKTRFEGTAIVDATVKEGGGSRQANAILWAALDRRYDFWSLLIARAANMLNAATGEEDWRSFAATAAALIDGAELPTLPVMEHVLDTSLAAGARDGQGARGVLRRGGPVTHPARAAP